ncbi:DUF4244 domain-containing protein [Arthrobacter liuii]|uniref:DUF4244 domain-containing protein n=1 Tax=Arthrobacter liuii TaxID=1476996 RepID=A0ABQ2AH63_9MICC|nr:DUF4244 domain-containing protein [Arthrobacter liuii]GGH90469.1 hypothetical protein GCM10007170_04310 [Arthrobacter liuii]
MSMNHRRSIYSAGTSALAASRQRPTGRDGSPRRTGGAPYVSAPASSVLDSAATNASVPLPDNVVELYPRSGSAPSPARRSARLLGSEAGMATAEYAIATLAAVGFAGLLVFILRSDEVRGFLLNLIRTALALP